MNRTEEAYFLSVLMPRKNAGELFSIHYEAMKFQLGTRSWYMPDFLCVRADGGLEIHEVKGFMESDAAVKLRVFASTYPFEVYLCEKEPRAKTFRVREVGKDW
jgi:hypothetical protein